MSSFPDPDSGAEKSVVESSPQPDILLARLVAASDYSHPPSEEELAWIHALPVGQELI